jgi:biopolymer transport protein ExbB
MTQLPDLLSATTASEGILTAWAFLRKGGVFMIPLGLTSIAGMTAVLYKLLSLSRGRVIPTALARQVENFRDIVASDRLEPLLNEFAKGRSTLARLANVAVRNRGRAKQDIVLAVESAAREETARLHAGIGVIDTVVTIAPLLGLLGTASGLVTIFEGLSDASNYMSIARGIAEAMTTTIAGLAIAVPGVIFHGYFNRRIEVITARLEFLLAGLADACQKPGS